MYERLYNKAIEGAYDVVKCKFIRHKYNENIKININKCNDIKYDFL